MKKTIILLLPFLLLLVSCKKEKCDEGCYSWGGGHICYKATIGYDFESAFDSLIKLINLKYIRLFRLYCWWR